MFKGILHGQGVINGQMDGWTDTQIQLMIVMYHLSSKGQKRNGGLTIANIFYNHFICCQSASYIQQVLKKGTIALYVVMVKYPLAIRKQAFAGFHFIHVAMPSIDVATIFYLHQGVIA